MQKGIENTTFSIVQVGSGGTVTVYLSAGTAKINVDASGYFALATLNNEGPGTQFYADPYPQTIGNTTRVDGLLPHGYDFNMFVAPYSVPTSVSTDDVSAVMVEIDAYEAAKPGSLTAYAYHGLNRGATTLAYRTLRSSSTIAIVPVTNVISGGYRYPAISILNNGPTGVEVVVTALGFFDQHDDEFQAGRYAPITPKHLFSGTMTYKQTKVITPGPPTTLETLGLLTTMSSTNPSTSTGIAESAVGFGPPPYDGQFHPIVGQTTTATAMLPLGYPNNEINVINGAATTPLSMWSYGMFNAWPQPSWPDYSDGGAVVSGAVSSPLKAQARGPAVAARIVKG